MSDLQAKAPFGFREPGTYFDPNNGVRNNMNEPPPLQPQYEHGVFHSTLQRIEKDIQEIVARNENNFLSLLNQMKSGNKFAERFKELQHEFHSQIEPLQKGDENRFEARQEVCKIASGYLVRLSELTGEVLQYLF